MQSETESGTESETESLHYWKSQAKYYELKAIDIQQELDECTEHSAQLQRELNSSSCQAEKQIRDLKLENQRLRNEIEMLQAIQFNQPDEVNLTDAGNLDRRTAKVKININNMHGDIVYLMENN